MELIQILNDMAAGKKNAAGDYWGLHFCREAAEAIDTLQAENAELAKLLTEGCNGFGSVLIQTSDMAGVNDWRKRVKEYLLITKHRSK